MALNLRRRGFTNVHQLSSSNDNIDVFRLSSFLLIAPSTMAFFLFFFFFFSSFFLASVARSAADFSPSSLTASPTASPVSPTSPVSVLAFFNAGPRTPSSPAAIRESKSGMLSMRSAAIAS